jgi:hypothetical protein
VAAFWLVLKRSSERNGELLYYETQMDKSEWESGHTCAVLPVWKPGQPEMAEYTTTSLRKNINIGRTDIDRTEAHTSIRL